MRVPVLAFVASLAIFDIAAAAEPGAESMALARRYANAIHMETQMVAVMQNMMPVMIERTAQRRGVKASPEVSAAVTKAAADTMQVVTPRMIEAMIPALAESFTVEELRAAVAYYESAPAQSLLAKMPTFSAKVMPALTPILPEIERELAERVCKELGCDPAQPGR